MKKKLTNDIPAPPMELGMKKLLLTMKLALAIVLLSVLQVSANTYSQSAINLNVHGKSLRDVLKMIEQKSSFHFFYSDDLLLMDESVNVAADNRKVEDILNDIFSGSELTYRVFDNNLIVIASKSSVKQDFSVTGIITGANGEPLIGVNVIVDGSANGTVTDFDGKYKLVVPNEQSVLVFSYVGYVTEKIVVADKRTIDLKMTEDVKNLQEVVVTALGIKRDKKALSYSSQQLSEDEISKGNNLNFVNSLNAKIAGVDLRKSNSGAGGSTKVLLRGSKSVFGSSQPLFVVDGVPVVNLQTSDPTGFWGGYDNGDGLSNFNPDDIESVTVLKGANAAALYGSQGSNGVILITTKKGVKGKTNVEISSSTTFQSASILPELQTSYGQTSLGALDSWGIKGAYSNPVDGFFKTGVDYINSVSVSGGNESTSAYLSYANSHSDGIMPTNKFNKNNLTFSQKSTFFKNLTVSSNIMLTDQVIDNKVLNGYYFNPLTGLYLFPRGLDFNSYKDNYQVFNSNRNLMDQNWHNIQDTQQNPYWILNNNANTESTKRLLGSMNMEYKISNALAIQARGNYDYTHQIYEQKIKAGTASTLAPSNGRWIYKNLVNTQQYADLLLTYNKEFGVFDIYGMLGTSYQKKVIGDGTFIDSDQSNLIVPNEFYINNLDLGNWKGAMNQDMADRVIKESVFADLSVGYKKMLYLNITGRNEWASTLAGTSKNNYFYPAFGLSAIISEMAKLPAAISFAKVRASYSMVGKEVPSFRTLEMNSISAKYGIVPPSEKAFVNMKPEMQISTELGLEMRFFENKAGFEATYYNIDNKDLFLPLVPPSTTGYKLYWVNAANVQNKGIELTAFAVPVKSSAFTWRTEINFSKNTNKIEKLHPDLGKNMAIDGGGEGYDIRLKEGGSIGDIYVNGYKRNANGTIILNSDTLPVVTDATDVFAGNANPKFSLGWNNTITYKNFSVSFLIDGKFGGKFVDMSEAWYDGFGLSKRTAEARDAGKVMVSGVKEDGTTPISGAISPKKYYTKIGGRNSFVEPYVYDATNIRMRQVVITYHLNLKKYKVLFDHASFSLVGQNLFFFYLKAPFDPDNTISTGNGTQSVESFCLPPTRSIGFNIKLNF